MTNMDADKSNIGDVLQGYTASLKRFIASKVANHADVDDILHDVLIKTFEQMASLENPQKFKVWLFQIAQNAVIDFYRKQGRGSVLNGETLWNGTEDEPSTHSMLTECIMPFLNRLPEADANLLVQADITRTPQKDIAKTLGVPYSTLKSRVTKARQNLRKQFDTCCSYEVDRRGSHFNFTSKSSCNGC